MTRTRNSRFSKPIVTRDGTRLVSLVDAANFLNALRGDQITAPVYYVGVLLSQAIEGGRSLMFAFDESVKWSNSNI